MVYLLESLEAWAAGSLLETGSWTSLCVCAHGVYFLGLDRKQNKATQYEPHQRTVTNKRVKHEHHRRGIRSCWRRASLDNPPPHTHTLCPSNHCHIAMPLLPLSFERAEGGPGGVVRGSPSAHATVHGPSLAYASAGKGGRLSTRKPSDPGQRPPSITRLR